MNCPDCAELLRANTAQAALIRVLLNLLAGAAGEVDMAAVQRVVDAQIEHPCESAPRTPPEAPGRTEGAR